MRAREYLVPLECTTATPIAEALVGAPLDRHTKPAVRGGRLRPRLIDSGDGAPLAVFHDSRTERREEAIVLPAGIVRATDVDSHDGVGVADGECRATVEPQGVRVARLSR